MKTEIGDLVIENQAARNGSSKITLTVGSCGPALSYTVLEKLEDLLVKKISRMDEFIQTQSVLRSQICDNGTITLHAEPYRPDSATPPSASRLQLMVGKVLQELQRQYLIVGHDLNKALDRALEDRPRRLKVSSPPVITTTQLAEAIEPCLDGVPAAQHLKKQLCGAIAADIMARPMDDRHNEETIQKIVSNHLQDCLPPLAFTEHPGAASAAGLNIITRAMEVLTQGPGRETQL